MMRYLQWPTGRRPNGTRAVEAARLANHLSFQNNSLLSRKRSVSHKIGKLTHYLQNCPGVPYPSLPWPVSQPRRIVRLPPTVCALLLQIFCSPCCRKEEPHSGQSEIRLLRFAAQLSRYLSS